MVITDLHRRIEIANDCVRAAYGNVEPVRLIEGDTSYAYPDGTTGISRYHARGDFLNDTVWVIGYEHLHHSRKDYYDFETPKFFKERTAGIGGLLTVEHLLYLGLSGRNTELIRLPLAEQLVLNGAVRIYTGGEMLNSYRNALVAKGVERGRAQDAAAEIVASMEIGRRAIVEITRRLTREEVDIMRRRGLEDGNEDY